MDIDIDEKPEWTPQEVQAEWPVMVESVRARLPNAGVVMTATAERDVVMTIASDGSGRDSIKLIKCLELCLTMGWLERDPTVPEGRMCANSLAVVVHGVASL